jgi:predicted metal-dependent hydrolase
MDTTYRVIYSKRRTLGITVERDGTVIVRAPEGTSPEDIELLVQKKRRWIHEKVSHPQKYEVAPHPPGKEVVAGESLLYLGRNYRIEIIDSHVERVVFDERFQIPRTTVHRARQLCREWYLQRARERLVPRAHDWGTRLGLRLNGVSIVDIRYRWGSCTASGNVRLNWRLIKAPPSVADYVIVHEVVHLIEASHGDRFWSIVRSHLPKVDEARTWLKDHGHLLEQDL